MCITTIIDDETKFLFSVGLSFTVRPKKKCVSGGPTDPIFQRRPKVFYRCTKKKWRPYRPYRRRVLVLRVDNDVRHRRFGFQLRINAHRLIWRHNKQPKCHCWRFSLKIRSQFGKTGNQINRPQQNSSKHFSDVHGHVKSDNIKIEASCSVRIKKMKTKVESCHW